MEVEKERRRMCDARYPWKPKKDEPLPVVDEISKKRGFLIFQKYGSDKVFPWSRPKKEELASALRVFAFKQLSTMPILVLQALSYIFLHQGKHIFKLLVFTFKRSGQIAFPDRLSHFNQEK